MSLRAAPAVGVAACVATVLALAAPFVLITDPGTGLAIYYGAGPLGASGIGFLALLNVVVFLAGERGRTDATTAAGIALAVGVATVGLSFLWASAVTQETVFSFPAAWMGYHRWVVVGLSALIAASGAAYARETL